MTQRFVYSSDGVRIAVFEQGNPDGPTLVLAHGYPDTHRLWDPDVALLADRFRIISYDDAERAIRLGPSALRRTGWSGSPTTSPTVIDAVSAGAVHVLAHDWGSTGSGSSWRARQRLGGSRRSPPYRGRASPTSTATSSTR